MLLYYSIVCKDATDCFFFVFAFNELEHDRCFFELCLLFLLTFSNRIILFSFYIVIFVYHRVYSRRDDIISTSSALYVYLILILLLSTFWDGIVDSTKES